MRRARTAAARGAGAGGRLDPASTGAARVGTAPPRRGAAPVHAWGNSIGPDGCRAVAGGGTASARREPRRAGGVVAARAYIPVRTRYRGHPWPLPRHPRPDASSGCFAVVASTAEPCWLLTRCHQYRCRPGVPVGAGETGHASVERRPRPDAAGTESAHGDPAPVSPASCAPTKQVADPMRSPPAKRWLALQPKLRPVSRPRTSWPGGMAPVAQGCATTRVRTGRPPEGGAIPPGHGGPVRSRWFRLGPHGGSGTDGPDAAAAATQVRVNRRRRSHRLRRASFSRPASAANWPPARCRRRG